jgi:multidrug efflux pump subunit AcrA (membrane-fusion protein)
MKRDFLLWLIALALLGNLLAMGYLIHRWMKQDREQEAEAEKVAANKPEERLAPGEVAMPAKQANSYLVEPVRKEKPWYETITVYGRVVPNPYATLEVRSAFPGTLRKSSGPWPEPGEWIKAGQEFGRIDIRLGPQERLDLKNKLSEAEKKLNFYKTVKGHLDQLMNETKEGASLREREEVEYQLLAAQSAFDLYKKADEELQEIDRNNPPKNSQWNRPLLAASAGEVAELAAKPGMTVEAGGLILRLVNFNQVLLRLDFPPEVMAAGAPAETDVMLIAAPPPALQGARNQSQPASPPKRMKAKRQGPAPQVDEASQLAGFFFKFDLPETKTNGNSGALPHSGMDEEGNLWRPNLFVKAEVPKIQGEPREAVSVPGNALLYHQGRALVYVKERTLNSKGREFIVFSRREVQILGDQEDRWILAAGAVRVGEEVVSDEPQVFLSAEFLSTVDVD